MQQDTYRWCLMKAPQWTLDNSAVSFLVKFLCDRPCQTLLAQHGTDDSLLSLKRDAHGVPLLQRLPC